MEAPPMEVETQEVLGEKFCDFTYLDRTYNVMKRNQPFAGGIQGVRLSIVNPLDKTEYGWFTGVLEKDSKGKSHYAALGVGNSTYGNDTHIPGLIGESIAQMVGKGVVNEWKSAVGTNLSGGSRKMYDRLQQRAQQKDSKFTCRKSLPFQQLQYTLSSK